MKPPMIASQIDGALVRAPNDCVSHCVFYCVFYCVSHCVFYCVSHQVSDLKELVCESLAVHAASCAELRKV